MNDFSPRPWLREGLLVYALRDSDPPWYRGGIRQQENRFSVRIDRNGGRCPETEAEANARLIAAAPDLYEACAEFVRKVDAGEAQSSRSYTQMKAALAKARGETN